MRFPSFKQLVIGLATCFSMMLFAGAASINTAQAEPVAIFNTADVMNEVTLASGDVLQPGFFASEAKHSCSQSCHHNHANFDIDADATRNRTEVSYYDISPAMLRTVFTVKHDRHFKGVLTKVPWQWSVSHSLIV